MLEDGNFQYVLESGKKMEHNLQKSHNIIEVQNEDSILPTITKKRYLKLA